jgi:membrane protein DedA with SNARE-associated domain
MQVLIHFFSEYGYISVFSTLILCGFGLPVPEDIALVSGGVISSLGKTNVHFMFLVSMLGVLLGDLAVYNGGRHFSPVLLKNKFIAKLLSHHRFEWIQEKYEKWGSWVIFMGRFMPGLRMPIFFMAGMTNRVTMINFFLIDFVAAIISVPVWIYLGYFLGHNHDLLLAWIHNSQLFLAIVIAIVLGALFFKFQLKKKLYSV